MKRQNTLYFVGKPYPHRASLERARELGYELGVLLDKNVRLRHADLFSRVIPVDFAQADSVAAQIGEPESLSAAGLICTYETYILAKAALDEHLGLPGNSARSARLCTDKLLMRQAFQQADAAITPDFAAASSEAALLQFARKHAYPLFIKPANLVKSLLVLRCANEDELVRNYAYARRNITRLYAKYRVYGREPHLIVEEGITGSGCSVAAFVDSQGVPHYCPGVVQLATAADKGIADNYLYARVLPAGINPRAESKLFATATKGIRALSMRSTPAHVEMMYDASGNAKIIEIGARIGGYRNSMYGLSYGIDMTEQEVRLATGQQPDIHGSLQAYTGVYELFPEDTGTFAGVEGTDKLDDSVRYTVKAKPGQTIGPAKHGYKASGVVVVSTKDRQAFQKQAAKVGKLRIKVQT